MRRWYQLSFLSILIGPVLAQANYPNCSAGWDWSYNTLNQNPCNIAALLWGPCSGGGNFEIPTLPPGSHYGGPTAAEDNLCGCNTVTYSLISACAACQGSSTWIQWTSWTTNCSTVAPPSTYPNPIPSNTRVPHWAYIDVVTANNWSVSAAESAGDSPEATPTVSSTNQPSSTTSPSSNSKQHKSHTGAIAGSIVAGVVGVTLLTAFALWYRRRRRRLAEPQPSPFALSEPNTSVSFGTSKLYDPNDPSTFPRPFVESSAAMIQTTSSAERDYNADLMRSQDRSRYPGLPIL